MYSLFEHAKRHELCNTNPMETVRQGSKRLRKPDVLKLDEIRALMQEIASLAIRLAVLVAGVTGLRRSEVRGLKWRDIDIEAHWITPTFGANEERSTCSFKVIHTENTMWRGQSIIHAEGVQGLVSLHPRQRRVKPCEERKSSLQLPRAPSRTPWRAPNPAKRFSGDLKQDRR